MSDPRGERPRRRGFTLLEVLVAVALLGVVVSVLARSAIQGMSYEGDAARRTRASLLADRALFGVEAGLRLGPPQALHQETEEGEEFRVTVDVEPLDLGTGGLDALVPAREEKEGLAGRATADAPTASVALALFRVFVQVSWLEGVHERSVTRSSFAFDGTAAAQILGAEDAAAQVPGPEGEEGRPTPTAEAEEP